MGEVGEREEFLLISSFPGEHLLRKIVHIERIPHSPPNRMKIALHVWRAREYMMRKPYKPALTPSTGSELQGFRIMYTLARRIMKNSFCSIRK
ncbi:hypothetical protein Y032_0019g3849 [Ancylostoma ceylanicum]|uniref:Uncharacterized protein n=1 Tax=Ancylostoma ceylanicum TaxID=53326 RepID=A0A016V213_9BILA|nr:hypothetical protein Y032_0019g3849 [Ancylostoma ceylanicum]